MTKSDPYYEDEEYTPDKNAIVGCLNGITVMVALVLGSAAAYLIFWVLLPKLGW